MCIEYFWNSIDNKKVPLSKPRKMGLSNFLEGLIFTIYDFVSYVVHTMPVFSTKIMNFETNKNKRHMPFDSRT